MPTTPIPPASPTALHDPLCGRGTFEPGTPTRTEPLRPTLALILYTGAASHSLTLKHRVLRRAQPGQQAEHLTFGPGTALTTKETHQLIQALTGTDLIPVSPHTIAVSPTATAWWRPPAPQAMQFTPKHDGNATITRYSGLPLPHPGLVFIASPGTLRVYAVNGTDRPTLDTPLHHAPYWNLFASGQVCRGSTPYPPTAAPDTHPAWEHAFFSSTFTGPSRSDRYIHWDASYEELLQDLASRDAFPDAYLLPARKTLRSALSAP